MSGTVDDLGIKCPNYGQFYVCSDKATRFVGCCTVDPCATSSGLCPERNLEPTSFDPMAYNKIPPQECADDIDGKMHIESTDYKADVHWYTCRDQSPPFMGCCSGNPCQPGGCPVGMIWPAKLNKDDTKAAVFLNQTTGTTSTSASAPTATVSQESGRVDGGQSQQKYEGLSKVGIAGVSVAAAAAALLIGLVIFFFLRRMRRRRQLSSHTVEELAGDSPADEPQEPKKYAQFQQQHLSVATDTISELPATPSQNKAGDDAGRCAASMTSELPGSPQVRQSPLFELEDSSRGLLHTVIGGEGG